MEDVINFWESSGSYFEYKNPEFQIVPFSMYDFFTGILIDLSYFPFLKHTVLIFLGETKFYDVINHSRNQRHLSQEMKIHTLSNVVIIIIVFFQLLFYLYCLIIDFPSM